MAVAVIALTGFIVRMAVFVAVAVFVVVFVAVFVPVAMVVPVIVVVVHGVIAVMLMLGTLRFLAHGFSSVLVAPRRPRSLREASPAA